MNKSVMEGPSVFLHVGALQSWCLTGILYTAHVKEMREFCIVVKIAFNTVSYAGSVGVSVICSGTGRR